MRTEYAGMKLLWIVIGSATVLCVLLYQAILRIPVRIRNYIRHTLSGSATADALRVQRDQITHLRRCKSKNDAKRLSKLNLAAKRAAARRRVVRSQNSISYRILQLTIRLLHPYTSTANWLAAYALSVSVFHLLLNDLPPWLLGGVVMFIPVALIVIIDEIRTRLVHRTPNQPSLSYRRGNSNDP